eukprot:4253723-Amphidinium_carterae.2
MRVEAQAMLTDRHAMTPLTWDEETEHGMEFVPKARWILVGFKDPHLDVLMADSYSPTPSMFVTSIGLCALASLKYEIYVADLAHVFLQSEHHMC